MTQKCICNDLNNDEAILNYTRGRVFYLMYVNIELDRP